MKSFFLQRVIDMQMDHLIWSRLRESINRCRCTHHAVEEGKYFLTGLDEHGQKVQQGARKRYSPLERCDRIADQFQDMLSKLEISNDDYIRTTETRHQEVVGRILQFLYEKGEIYKAEYQGFIHTG